MGKGSKEKAEQAGTVAVYKWVIISWITALPTRPSSPVTLLALGRDKSLRDKNLHVRTGGVKIYRTPALRGVVSWLALPELRRCVMSCGV